MRASAPGKVFLLGEYAVTEGATALVAAVDRRAEARWASDPPPASAVVAAVLEAARARGVPIRAGGPSIDTTKGTELCWG